MRDHPRPRRSVSPGALRLLRPLYRFSAARDAYVLRVAGGRHGPVLVDRTRLVPEPEPVVVLSQPTGRFARVGEPVAGEAVAGAGRGAAPGEAGPKRG